METYRVKLSGVSNNEMFRIKLLERPLNAGTRVFVEGFYIEEAFLVAATGVMCVRSQTLQDTRDYDTRTERPSRVIAKFGINPVNGLVSYADPCLCSEEAGIRVNDLGCLHGNIDVSLTRENGELLGLINGSSWSLDLLFLEPI